MVHPGFMKCRNVWKLFNITIAWEVFCSRTIITAQFQHVIFESFALIEYAYGMINLVIICAIDLALTI